MLGDAGKFLILAGAILVGLGLLLMAAGKIPLLGELPGDIRHEGRGMTFYFPIATCIVLSIVLTILLNLLIRFLGRR